MTDIATSLQRAEQVAGRHAVNAAAQMVVAAVGFRVREQRLRRNLTLEELARVVGLTVEELTRLENRQLTTLGFGDVDTLARALACAPEYLLGLRDEPHRALHQAPWWEKPVDWAAAGFWALLAGWHVSILSRSFSLLQLALAAFNLIVAYAFVRRRPAYLVGRRTQLAVAFVATLLPLVGFYPAAAGWKDVGLVVELAGLTLTAAGILTLGRAFGMGAANRGVVTTGAYRLVRHPIYASELLMIAGYVLANVALVNLVALALWLACVWLRMTFEESVLGADDAYRAYRARVRWRLIPRVW